MIGKTIANYSILSVIGEGGMGTVYLAEHFQLKRKVAIKFLNSGLVSDESIKDRFMNEAIVLSKLSHQNIVLIYDFGRYDDNMFIVMEYLSGYSLDELIKKNHQGININTALEVIDKVLKGLSYAHSKNVIHRDIKPSNIFVLQNEEIKILDFGIAKFNEKNSRLTKTGSRIGTPMYMSPEQVLGNEVDTRADLYSTGIILYELLTGRQPYYTPTGTDYELMNCILNQDIIFSNSESDHLLNYLFRKLCAKNPNDRFANGEEAIQIVKDCSNYYSTRNTTPTPAPISFENKKSNIKTVISSSNIQNENGGNGKKVFIFATMVVVSILIFFVIYIQMDKADTVRVNVESSKRYNSTTQLIDNSSNQDEKNASTKFDDWIKATNNKSGLTDFYAEQVDYYDYKRVSPYYVSQSKTDFYNKYNTINISASDLSVTEISKDYYIFRYDKEFQAYEYYGGVYEGKVRSRLELKNIDGKWLITTETDDKIYWTNKK